MGKNTSILLIQETPADEYLKQTLEHAESRYRVQSVDRIPTALARLAGGGVDLVILDLSLSIKPELERLDNFLELRSKAPEVPIVVIDDCDKDGLVPRAAKIGSADYLTKARCLTELGPVVRSALDRRLVQFQPRPQLIVESRKPGTVTTFLGAKGGVGTTTLALNVASALAQWGKVILTELRPTFGALAPYFQPRHLPGNIANLVHPDNAGVSPPEISRVLWPYKSTPGLHVLFGPQTVKECGEVAEQTARAIVKNLAMLAEHVVVDLPASLSEANRSVIEASDCLLLVVERDPWCVECARPILDMLRSWNVLPPLMGSVIVNRASFSTPMDLAEIEMKLAIPTFSVIPPAAELCIAAQKAAMPLASLDSDSIAARGMIGLAERLAFGNRKAA